jgi:iron complex outermembrane receptor protein
MKLVSNLFVAAGTVGAVMASGMATAQEQTQDSLALEEIIVTAERRESNVQDVPAAVSAFDQVELERRQAFNVIDVVTNVPNLFVSNNPGQAASTTIFLRGIGSTESIVTLDTAIGFYLDDIYFARQGVNNLSLFDVERIEVLRGPQGTLYGRNTSGGAVRVITKRPDNDFEGEVEANYGEFDRWSLRGSVNVPFSDTFQGRFSALIEQGDGITENVILNKDVNDRDNWGARAAFRWLPADAVEVNLAYDYYRAENNGVYGYDIAGLVRPAASDYFISTSGDETYNISHTNGGSLTVDWKISDTLDFTSITGVRNIYQKYELDFTDQPVPIFKLWTENDTDQITQEFRLSGNAQDNRLKYVVGAYYYDEKSKAFIGDQINLNPAPGVRVPLPFFRRYYDVDSTSYAAFAEVNYDITEKFTVTLGGRYTEDDKSLDIEQWIGGPFAFSPPGGGGQGYNNATLEALGIPMDIKDDNFSIKAGVQYKFSDDILAYFTYAQGFKSGGWSARTNNAAEFVDFDPEYLDSYEIGLKTTVFDGRARLNYTAFYYDYTDFFATATGTNGNFIVSTQDAEFYGLEFEATGRISSTLDVFAALGYQDGEYKGVSPLVFGTAIGEVPQRMPEWSTKVGATYLKPLQGANALRLTVDYNFLKDHFTNLQNSPLGASGNVEIWNALLAYEIDDGKYQISASCKNCFDNRYLAQSFDFAGIGFVEVYPGDPRTWLLGVKAKF